MAQARVARSADATHFKFSDTVNGRMRITLETNAFSVKAVEGGEQTWSAIELSGLSATSEPGLPLLPTKGALFGVGSLDGLSLRVVSAEFSTHKLEQPIEPATTYAPDGSATVKANTEVYSSNAFWPAQIAQIGDAGILRDQPFAQVQLTPFQLNPVKNELRHYHTIVVELSWQPTENTSPPQQNLPQVEQYIAETLANYTNLGRPDPILPNERLNLAQPRDIVSATERLKLTVEANGMYELTSAELEAAGWSTASINPATLQLHHRGQQVAIDVLTDPLRVRFYGEAYEDIYTRENAYWLSQGTANGLRITHVDGTPTPSGTSAFLSETVHAETDSFYWNTMTNAGPGEDFWFWGDRIAPSTSNLDDRRDFTVTLGAVSTVPHTATVQVRLKGYTALEHDTRVLVNGTVVTQSLWSGQGVYDLMVPVASSLLVSDNNVVTVEAVDVPDTAVDQILVDWIEIAYGKSLSAETLPFSFATALSPTQAITLTNLPSASVQLFDISNPYRVRQIDDAILSAVPPYSLSATLPASGTGQFYLVDDAAFASVATIETVTDTGLSAQSNAADYIIISHADFVTEAQRLSAHRQTQGLTTMMVDVADLYNEFNYGLFAPDAIRNFLEYAYDNWQSPAPSYVVLFGDGSQDYKDNLNSGSRNFVPPRMINTFDYGQIPADNWYVTFKGNDPLAEMHIGRLSAETITHATNIVDDLIRYDSLPTPDSASAVFVADDGSTIFEFNSQELANRLPSTYTHTNLFARDYVSPTLSNDIVNAITSTQPTLINYSGHGNYYRWGSYRPPSQAVERIWTEALTDPLANSGALPFITIANCLNGFFSIPSNLIIDPYDESMAEALQRQQHGGAVAVWADAGFGYTSGQRVLMNALYEALFNDNTIRYGPATETAKAALYAQSTFWEQNVRTMTLFGDPVTQLNTPEFIPLATEHIAQQAGHSKAQFLPFYVALMLVLSTYFISRRQTKINLRR